LKIIANALSGIFAELNKDEFGKNDAKQMDVFSGEESALREERSEWHRCCRYPGNTSQC